MLPLAPELAQFVSLCRRVFDCVLAVAFVFSAFGFMRVSLCFSLKKSIEMGVRERDRERERLLVHSETQPRLEPVTCPYMHIRLS